jgi:hypothetical protein
MLPPSNMLLVFEPPSNALPPSNMLAVFEWPCLGACFA